MPLRPWSFPIVFMFSKALLTLRRLQWGLVTDTHLTPVGGRKPVPEYVPGILKLWENEGSEQWFMQISWLSHLCTQFLQRVRVMVKVFLLIPPLPHHTHPVQCKNFTISSNLHALSLAPLLVRCQPPALTLLQVQFSVLRELVA